MHANWCQWQVNGIIRIISKLGNVEENVNVNGQSLVQI